MTDFSEEAKIDPETFDGDSEWKLNDRNLRQTCGLKGFACQMPHEFPETLT